VNDLYLLHGAYRYKNGFNRAALIALVLGILPNVPGFLATVGLIEKDAAWSWVNGLYNYAWFVGFFVSGLTYMLFMKPGSQTNEKTKGKILTNSILNT
jgi:NCS1 family nucleobase:cation symporter-1